MAYKNFKELDIREKLHLKEDVTTLFSNIKAINPSSSLIQFLEDTKPLRADSEKAISEMIVFPVLLELRRKNPEFITLYSGENLDVDKKVGLNGCS